MTYFLESFPEPLHGLTWNCLPSLGVDQIHPHVAEIFEECSRVPEVDIHVTVAVTDEDWLTPGPLGLEQPHVVRRDCVLQLEEASNERVSAFPFFLGGR